jgi:hypothetical protein
MSFIIINIYFLLLLNAVIVLFIVGKSILEKTKQGKIDKLSIELEPLIKDFVEKDKNGDILKNKIQKKYAVDVVMNLLIQYGDDNNKDVTPGFEKLGLYQRLIKKANNKLDIDTVKTLARIKSPKAYDILVSGIESENFELMYMSFYALSLIKLEEKKSEYILDRLMESNILRDRIIEIVENFNLSAEKYLQLLEQQTTELGKVVYLRVLQKKEQLALPQNPDRLLIFLQDSKEVRLSAVLALASSKNEKYLESLVKLFEVEKEWEVRSSIAKALVNFPKELILEPLKKMIYDDQWWVRFNVVGVLATLGQEGIQVLIDLSLDSDNSSVSNLAYNVLSSSKEVHETIIMN